jgi:hypothetical protein
MNIKGVCSTVVISKDLCGSLCRSQYEEVYARVPEYEISVVDKIRLRSTSVGR